MSCFTPLIYERLHLTILYPFPQLNLSLLVYNLHVLIKRVIFLNFKKSILLLAIPVFIQVIVNLNILYVYHLIYYLTGGAGIWSQYIFNVIEYLSSKKDIEEIKVCTFNYGIANAIIFNSHNFIPVGYVFEDSLSYTEAEEMIKSFILEKKNTLRNKNIVWYFVTDGGQERKVFGSITNEEFLSCFKRYIKKVRKGIFVDKIIFNKINDPAFVIYKIE